MSITRKPTPEQILAEAEVTVADAQEINRFLQSPAILRALERIELKYRYEFKKATNSEERIRAQSKMCVVDDILNEIAGIQETGDLGRAVIAAANKPSDRITQARSLL